MGGAVATYRGHTRFVRSIAWSPSGSYIASGGDYGDSTVQIWQAFCGKHVYTYSRQYRFLAIAWSPISRRIVPDSLYNSVHAWDAFTRDNICINSDQSGPAYTLSCAPNHFYIRSGGPDK